MDRTQAAEQQRSLKSVPFFAVLEPDVLEQIQRRCVWQRHEPEGVIVDYLDTSDDVFFVVEGEVRVTIYSSSGKVVSFCELGPGEVFGEYAAIDGGPRSASVVARTTCLVASMSGVEFLKVFQSQPAVALAIARQLVGTIRALDRRVYEFSTLAVNNRIRSELLRLANLNKDDNSARIVPAPTHSEIASRVSTNREAVTRELNRISRLGIIERQGDALLVKDLHRLAVIVHDVAGE
jgi:CRP-like cAMP-binding protein